ncbi:MAG: terpene cyclase/mutase family protein [Planctomycetales bacterium]|nr:terpene cyclase/mutase family protein [Planctomycetales bacterium]
MDEPVIHYRHLTELAGIRPAESEDRAYWPLNVTLVLLTATIIGIAFYFLDRNDTRLSHNPWTYLFVTPVAMLLISTVLGSLVSRVVEKSMQVAFLLSVLVHLVLLVCAVNIVIISRMWSDVFESIAEQRKQLQRESTNLHQYFRLSTTRTDGQQPDYLSHVVTQHQPTDIKDPSESALRLARSEQAELTSPDPELQPSVSQHLVRKKEPVASMVVNVPEAAHLSRSTSEFRIEAPQVQTLSLDVLLTEQDPREVQPSKADINGHELSTDLSYLELPKLPEDSIVKSRPEVERAMPQQPIQFPTNQPIHSTIPKDSLQFSIHSTVPDVPEPSREQPVIESLRPRDDSVRSNNQQPMSVLSTSEPALVPEFQPSLAREASQRKLLDLPMSASWSKPTTSTPLRSVGGREGDAPKLSSPTISSEALQVQGEFLQPAVEPRAVVDVANRMRGSPGQSDDSQMLRSPLWLDSVVQDLGSSNLPSSAVKRAEGVGPAAREDVADLQSADLDLESRNARPLPSSLSRPTNMLATDQQAGDGGELQSTDLIGQLRSKESSAALKRGSRETNPSGAQSGSRSAQVRPRNESTELGARSSLNNPEFESARHSSTSNLLQIPAPPGLGGFSTVPSSATDLLAARSPREVPNANNDLLSQRFARADTGGPMAPGATIDIPRPAFQQRVERLQNPQPVDSMRVEPQTEAAIERGLAFLAKTQRDDGAWRLQDYDSDVLMRSDTAATGLALLAFQGAGYTHRQFKYADNVKRGLRFLLKHQTVAGDLYIRQDPASDQNAWLYSHAIAALALCEAYGMTQDPELRTAAQRAVDFMVASQDPERGGWRYRPGSGSDTSVTGWFMMACQSGRLAGLEIPDSLVQNIERFLAEGQVSNQQPFLYRYNPFAADTPQQRHGLQPTPVMTSVGLLMRLYTGWNRDSESMRKGADILLKYPPEPGTPTNSKRDTYYWYYATQVMFHMQGDHWKKWHDALYPLLIDNQLTYGANAGSWDPMSPTPDLWARYGGRLYVTAMNLLSLEVSYRHLPLYDSTAK